ncbi:D-3-phosphoglycerate dehydrogenase [Acidocella aminolytica 101 = DSM 11237]|uniref:Uncharacterized protein n=1 Tax=Acidocella aminolytica 101 = DSM 11237 TaxID=1120923 RepID=A0A0D6PCV9_9PROT|nr:hypothetical protein Aam_021_095 [Acidocella aminolytica 101 = DSM 11237]SHE47507.1 D-3-phosphoglycerate dehydrogenase [Acidocella aminolytica 101 = DSM 11237]
MAPLPLVIDLLEWIVAEPRDYVEVMDAWRTSCPRLPVWEDTVDFGLVERVGRGPKTLVQLTDAGRDLLTRNRS